eukprot:TRINITY_DN17223_c0_g3_i1.p3 TRINITY_DN17223_c0_g3~~TRINITY_DN17223_c0_g3_i1.p3  ORF type:complete len:210 (-),score=21.94 TRINITY_DN17223_c0_g3_i1:299-928(-)
MGSCYHPNWSISKLSSWKLTPRKIIFSRPKSICITQCHDQDILKLQEDLAVNRVRLDYFVESEEYEKAAEVRDKINLLEFVIRKKEVEHEKLVRSNILHSLGTVLVHKRYEYRGVIYGYDATCRAAEGWIKMMGVDDLPLGRNQPFYHVLVDVRDRPGGQTTYVAQENIIPMQQPTEVDNPIIEELFREFDGEKYIASNKLRELYPNDF